MSSFLITGGRGFIGSHLVQCLLKERHRVTVVSRHTPPAMDGGAVHAKGCFWDTAFLNGLGPFDGVYHLAACKNDTGDMRQVNVDGSEALARWAAEKRIPFFFHASSIEAQGPSDDAERKQSANDPCRPVSTYGESKLESERAVAAGYGDQGGCAVLARIGITYGPGSNGFVRPFLQACMSSGGPAQTFAGMKHVRIQPIFAADLARMLVRAYEVRNPGVCYFVGPAICSVAEWFGAVCLLMGESKFSVADTSATRPTTSLAEDVDQVVNYFSGVGGRSQRIYEGGPTFERLGVRCRYSLLRGAAETISWLLAHP